MIIWIDDAIFSGKVAQIDCLALLRQAAMRRHTVLISGDPLQCLPNATSNATVHAPHFTVWRNSLSLALQAEVELLRQRLAMVPANAVARSNMQRMLVSEQSWSLTHACCQIDVATALHALAQPLHILVENQINDGAFLRATMPADWREKLRQWEARGQLRFVQGGGITEILKFIQRYSQNQHAITEYGYPAEMWWYLHFIIYDHDGDSATKPSSEAEQIDEFLRASLKSKRAHRLRRRCQEHYLPQQAMLALLKIVAAKFSDIDLQAKEQEITEFFSSPDESRFFNKIIPAVSSRLKKNYFSAIAENQVPIQNAWFEQDGSSQEMRLLAEAIAAAL